MAAVVDRREEKSDWAIHVQQLEAVDQGFAAGGERAAWAGDAAKRAGDRACQKKMNLVARAPRRCATRSRAGRPCDIVEAEEVKGRGDFALAERRTGAI